MSETRSSKFPIRIHVYKNVYFSVKIIFVQNLVKIMAS